MITYDALHRGHILRETLTATAPPATAPQPCPDTHLARDYTAAGDQHPSGHPEDSWPETWSSVPARCPICDSPTVADRHLNSRAGPGWRCTHESSHYWLVRLNPLRRYLVENERPAYPWHNTPRQERQAWLEAHYHPPRLVPSDEEGGLHHALD